MYNWILLILELNKNIIDLYYLVYKFVNIDLIGFYWRTFKHQRIFVEERNDLYTINEKMIKDF